MATRACDFSSFKRPPKPSNANSTTSSEKTSSLRSNELDRSKEEPGEIAHRKLGTSLSVDPSMTQRSNYDYFGGSTSTFKDVTSPTTAPLYSFSSQNVDGYTSFQRPHAGSHSTIDRTTLPYDRRNKAPSFSPSLPGNREDHQSRLVFLDGGKRGVMNAANSQHCLNESLSGRRMDRSLAKGKIDSAENYHAPPYEASDFSHQGYNQPGYLQNSGGSQQYGYYTQDRKNMDDEPLPPNTGTYRGYPGNLGTNVSSGESGIAGCDYNTTTVPYEASAGDAYSSYRYNRSTSVNPQSPRPVFQPEPDQGSETADEEYCENDAELKRHSGEEITQQTLLLRSDSAVHFEPDLTDATHNFDPSASYTLGSAFNVSQKQASRTASKSKNKCNPFRKKSTDAIYKRNNLYGTKNRKSSKQNMQVTLGPGGMANTGLNFDKPYSSKKPFCPRWQCVALTVGIALTLFVLAALVMFFYVWPSVLEPLVESSKPIDGEWGNWRPWFECSATCGRGLQNRTRECDSPSPEDGGNVCAGPKYETRMCDAPAQCPDCTRVCEVGTLSADCRTCSCEGHVVKGRITDELNRPLSGVKVYKASGATLLLAGTDIEGEFEIAGVCSNGDNELRLEKKMYRVSRVLPVQSQFDNKRGRVEYAMTKLYLPVFITPPENEVRLIDQKVVFCCEAEYEQPPTKYVWYKDASVLDPRIFRYSVQNPSLILPTLMEWDSGEYSCEVQNEAGTVRSEPATLTVHKNWTELCDPTPKDNFIALPEGCERGTFNTGSCGTGTRQGDSESALPTDPSEVPTHSTCITPDQYPDDAPEDVCHVNADTAAVRNKYCCKPIAEEEVKIHCELASNVQYDMSFKRTLTCGCVLCNP